MLQRLGNVIARGTFYAYEKQTSSTYRELLAVKYVLQSFGELLKHEFVQWYYDTMNTSRIIEAGSTKPHLQQLALDIFSLSVEFDISLQAWWISVEENTIADSIFKYNDSDDWSIDNETFDYVQNLFCELTVDRFADK